MKQGFVIAIDGPVASGKGTLAPILAQKLNGFYLYTGAMFRTLALYCIQHNINFEDTDKIVQELPNVHIDLDGNRVVLNGQDVTERIKEADVAKGSSPVAVSETVRRHFAQLQRQIAQKYIDQGKAVVAEGRDVGTIVFPNADFKLFLTATPDTRTERRLAQYREKGNSEISFEEVLQDTHERDERDTNRLYAPLPKNPKELGYIILDNSKMSEEETMDAIIGELEKKNLL